MAEMTTAYIIKDDDPEGGYYSMSPDKPDMRHYNRRSIAEVREVEIPEFLWAWACHGMLPVDRDGSNDSVWAPFWAEGTTVWVRAGRTPEGEG